MSSVVWHNATETFASCQELLLFSVNKGSGGFAGAKKLVPRAAYHRHANTAWKQRGGAIGQNSCLMV